MNKITSILLSAMLAGTVFSARADDEKVAPEQVPQGLRTFVAQHFGSDVKIVEAERDRKFNGFEYEVKLSNGAEIDYGVSGEWLEVDCGDVVISVPETIINAAILQHVKGTYPGMSIEKITREYPGYEIKLSNGVELIYDSNYKFVRIDD